MSGMFSWWLFFLFKVFFVLFVHSYIQTYQRYQHKRHFFSKSSATYSIFHFYIFFYIFLYLILQWYFFSTTECWEKKIIIIEINNKIRLIFTAGALNAGILEEFRDKFYGNERNVQAQNVCARNDPLESCISRENLEKTNYIFQHKVAEVKPMTNQKSSGRCWIFAALNVIRIPFVKQYNIEEFEFSQPYLFFWDKVIIYFHLNS